MTEILPSHSGDKTLTEWLSYLENLHSTEIDLGLGRIGEVIKKLNIDFSFAKVITVAGTNGKGTTCAFIENALLNDKQTVAVYSSPHIDHFNERLRINKVNIDDDSLISAFEQIEIARADISLSYYEYTTLAAFIVLMQKKPSFIILEVGLGGRLDATNIIDADIAIITTVDLDHQSFLGTDRESIGYEKAGIMRKQQRVVIGDKSPPLSVLAFAKELNVDLHARDKQFFIDNNGTHWQWKFNQSQIADLKKPNIPKDNVATALMVLSLLNIKLTTAKVNYLIDETRVAGRTEIIKRHCDIMLDVGHNPQAARYLSDLLSSSQYTAIHAVVGMMADKDIINTLQPLTGQVKQWYLSDLAVPRAASAQMISEQLKSYTQAFICFDNIPQAFRMANQNAKATDLILVFGSFYTVADIRRLLV